MDIETWERDKKYKMRDPASNIRTLNFLQSLINCQKAMFHNQREPNFSNLKKSNSEPKTLKTARSKREVTFDEV